MKRRLVLGGMTSAVVLALAIGLIQRTDRRAPATPATPAAAPHAPAADPLAEAAKDHPQLSRAFASWRVFEEKTADGPRFRGLGYSARAGGDGIRYEADGFSVHMRATGFETGDGRTALDAGVGAGKVTTPSFARAAIDRGPVIEEYIFENRRVEQIFRIPQPLGPGALTVLASVQTDLGGPVIEVPRHGAGWRETPLLDGGLAFCDRDGNRRLAYHGAVAVDAAGRRQELDPHWRDGEIALEVPAAFMSKAVYPVVIDPWIELNFSSTGGGISNTPEFSQTPALALAGGTPYVVWAERVGGAQYQIFLRTWNGFNWLGIGGSEAGTGLSGTKGNATNPSVAVEPTGRIFVAWQDDTNVDVEIYLKKWDGATWAELKGSATTGGVSTSAGASTYPSVGFMEVTVPSTGKKSTVPVVAWQDLVSGAPAVHLAAYFPGDAGVTNDTSNDPNPLPASGVIPAGVDENFPVIDEGWYGFGTSTTAIGNSYDYFVQGLSSTPIGRVSERPKMVMQRVGGAWTAWVVWQDTRNTNYEVYSRKYVVPADALYDRQSTRFPGKVFPVFSGDNLLPLLALPVTGGNPRQTASWAATGAGSDSGGGISGTATPSLYPSIVTEASGNVYVAWEEEVSLADSEVMISRSVGPAGGFSGAANVSQTPSTGPNSRSSNPSVAVDGSFVYVAWADDQVSQTEIYVKRRPIGANPVTADFTVPAPGSGDPEVGFRSFSASIEVPVSTTPGVTGVSKTPGASIFPQIKSAGSPVLVWQDFAGANFEIFVQQYFENEPRTLRQTGPAGVPNIVFGSTTGSNTIELRATLFSEDTTRTVRMEVELIPIPATAAATVFQSSGQIAVDPITHVPAIDIATGLPTEVVIPFTGAVNVSYFWRARTVDNTGAASAWIGAGNNPDGAVDFTVSATALPPNAAAINNPLSLVGGAVHLTWTLPAGGADSFNIQRSSGGPFTVLVSGLSGTTTSYDDFTIVSGVTYTYIVTAVRGSGATAATTDSAPSAPITIPAGAGPPPDAVDKKRCGATGGEALLALAALALLRRRRSM